MFCEGKATIYITVINVYTLFKMLSQILLTFKVYIEQCAKHMATFNSLLLIYVSIDALFPDVQRLNL